LGKGHGFNKTTAGRRKTWKRHVSLFNPRPGYSLMYINRTLCLCGIIADRVNAQPFVVQIGNWEWEMEYWALPCYSMNRSKITSMQPILLRAITHRIAAPESEIVQCHDFISLAVKMCHVLHMTYGC
jgi:hypothetical protein